jgi:hypothetical protein
MVSACSTYGRSDKKVQRFWLVYLKRGDHIEDLGGDGRIMLQWILEVILENVGWIHLAKVGTAVL